MNEFELIQTYLAGLAGPEGLGLLDDVAQWSPPQGLDAVISTDTLVEGVHFPGGQFDFQLAQKLLRVNVSDIVSKGADPVGYLLSLTLNDKVGIESISSFCDGLAADQDKFGMKLWGGDTTRARGPNVLSVTIIGTVPDGPMVVRSGAKTGDIVCVTGDIGNSFLGLRTALNQMRTDMSETDTVRLLNAYHVPNPPYEFRLGIRKFASAALDISDGLIADAGHIAKASDVSVVINLTDIPLSPEAQKWVDTQTNTVDARVQLATGGDDYQVLLTVSPDKLNEIETVSIANGVNLTQIGHVESGFGVKVLDKDSKPVKISSPGYTHF